MILTLCLAVLLSPQPAALAPVASSAGDASQRVAKVATKETREDVALKTADDLTLVGDFYLPKDAGVRAPAVMLVHDAGASRLTLQPLAEKLQKQGFAVLLLDLRGHGQSATPKDRWEILDAGAREKLWNYAARDLEAGARWLRARADVHVTNLNMIGMRAGCTLAARQALRDENVRSLVLIEPQLQQLGFNLQGDVAELEGIPTFVAASKQSQAAAEGLVASIETSSIELVLGKEDLLTDKRLLADLTQWVGEQALPKRGR